MQTEIANIITHALFFKHTMEHFEAGKSKKATKHYWDTDLDFRKFECPDCVVYFQLDFFLEEAR